MAGFITRMELTDFDDQAFEDAVADLRAAVREDLHELYATACPACRKWTSADWFEVSAVAACPTCQAAVRISAAEKRGPGSWGCSECGGDVRFSVAPDADEALDLVYLTCP